MSSLGRITRIEDLRSIWPHEARDFSKWLAKEENLTLLSDEIGIDIVLEELESAVGDFSVDLYAREEGSSRRIIIENQLEDTNHDHLGKIITYASGKGAEVIIWIVKHARDEHRQAIEWLNQHTDENIGFFLVEIELWRINDSVPAPKFNVVERPNDWAKTVKAAGRLSETKKLQYEFWQAFCQYAFGKADFAQQFSRRKALPQHWYDLSIGSSACHVGLTVNTVKKTIGAEIYIDDDKALFEKYKSRKQEIEAELNTELIWRVAAKACRILAVNKGIDLQCREKWPEYFEWLCIMTCKLREITKQYG
ncbi:MAG: DUF4268 domain-containing protein [Christensenellales bacterium]|nr:DUF4268 domain-containing protein [Christensenellales bacterium]